MQSRISSKGFCHRFASFVCLGLSSLPLISAADAQISKADNTDALNLPTSWVNGVVPGPSDIAQWDSNVTAANSSALGADLSWLGIRILNPGGAIGITGSNLLTLGASGINMSAATQNLTISSPIVLGSPQTWSVRAGRALTINTTAATVTATTGATSAVSGMGPLTINGPGRVNLSGLGATYTPTGGIALSGGNGSNNVAATGATPNSANFNLFFDFVTVNGASTAGNTTAFALPALTVGGGNIHAQVPTGASNAASIVGGSATVLNVNAGNTNISQQRGTSSRVIYQFGGGVNRSVGGTINFRDDIAGNGNSNNSTGGGYRFPVGNGTTQANTVNGVVPFVTFTTTAFNTSWFVPSPLATVNSGTAYNAFTSSTANSLGASGASNPTANSTVVTDVDLTNTGANTVNTIRFNDTTLRTVTMGAADSLTVAAGGILITNNTTNITTFTAGGTITGGTLMGGNPGSGSANDLIVFQYNNTAPFQVNSVIADNNTSNPGPTALTKSGAGVMLLGAASISTYTGPTTVNAGTLLVNGSTAAASAVTVKNGGAIGGGGAISGPITLEGGGRVAPGPSVGAIGTLMGASLTLNSNNTASNMTFDLSAADNTSDRLTLSGALTKGTGTTFIWDFTGGQVGTTYTLANFASTNFVASDFTIATTGYAGTFTVNANDIMFQVTQTPVPEPSVWAMMLIGGAGGVFMLRRRARAAS